MAENIDSTLAALSELAGCTGEGFVLAMAAAYKAGLEAGRQQQDNAA